MMLCTGGPQFVIVWHYLAESTADGDSFRTADTAQKKVFRVSGYWVETILLMGRGTLQPETLADTYVINE